MAVASATAGHMRDPGGRPTGADPRSKARILARLRRIAARLAAVSRMVEEDRHCIDVIRRTQAVQGVIGKTKAVFLEHHVGRCVTVAMRATDPRDRERGIAELRDIFEHSRRR